MLPFGIWPGHWGLKGKTRERAKIEYELTGYDLEYALASLDLSGPEFSTALNELNMKYHKITNEEYLRTEANIKLRGNELELRLLELDKKFGLIKSDIEYNKRRATLKNESWVHILNVKPDSDKAAHGELELDWNDKFVEELKESGYIAPTDEQIVDLWLVDLCRNIALEHYSGQGTFDEQVEAGIDIKKEKLDDGRWEAR